MAGAEGLTDSPCTPLEGHGGQEIAGHHPCAGCHEPLSGEEISEGAEPCSNCELEGAGTAMIHDLEE